MIIILIKDISLKKDVILMDLGCKLINANDLIKCTFGLNKTELKLFLFLMHGDKHETISSISKNLSLDRTTIQKCIKKLIEKEIFGRLQSNLKNGGFVFRYYIKKKQQIKEKMQQILNEWYSSASKEITTLFTDYIIQ